ANPTIDDGRFKRQSPDPRKTRLRNRLGFPAAADRPLSIVRDRAPASAGRGNGPGKRPHYQSGALRPPFSCVCGTHILMFAINRTRMGAALLERRRSPKKSGILPNFPIAERGPRGRYELQTISYYQEATLYGSLRCCSRPGSG